jgi:hypothetical protein
VVKSVVAIDGPRVRFTATASFFASRIPNARIDVVAGEVVSQGFFIKSESVDTGEFRATNQLYFDIIESHLEDCKKWNCEALMKTQTKMK